MRNVELNFKRLNDDLYQIENIFQKNDYGWQGDWEGRAILAFNCLYEITGKVIPCLSQMMEKLEKKTNEKLFFGDAYNGFIVDEQQLSGHSWYMRGLTKQALNFGDEKAKKALYNTFNGLYLPIIDRYNKYPLKRQISGGVSGESGEVIDGWRVSSDVGCAYMCVDGIAHYYDYSKDENCRKFLQEIIEVFINTDFVECGFQTHTTLSCLRGILQFYLTTGDKKYLNAVIEKFNLYQKFGMTLTYENFNWFKREDSWTEPCAIVDSFILATKLYKITNDEKYLTLARRIWFNGMQFCQRENGGVGPNSCVTLQNPILKISMYEAPFCCTMRYSEGLLEYHNNRELFVWNKNKEIEIDNLGRRFIDDKLLVKVGEEIKPIFSCNDLSKSDAENLKLEVIF